MQFCLVMFWQFSTILVCFTSSWLSVHRITWYSSGNTLSLLLGLFSISNLQTGNPFTWATLEQQNKSLLLLTDLAVNLRHIETDLLPPLNTDLGKVSDATRSDMINDPRYVDEFDYLLLNLSLPVSLNLSWLNTETSRQKFSRVLFRTSPGKLCSSYLGRLLRSSRLGNLNCPLVTMMRMPSINITPWYKKSNGSVKSVGFIPKWSCWSPGLNCHLSILSFNYRR